MGEGAEGWGRKVREGFGAHPGRPSRLATRVLAPPALLGVVIAGFGVLGTTAAAGQSYYAIEGEPVPSNLGEAVRHGSGPDTLLLIPCASCRWRSFDEFMERNADRYTMYAVTLPGYGGTPLPDLEMWTDSTLWRDHAVGALSDLLDREGVGGAVVIGASYGTTVAIHLARRRPDVVRGVINLDGGFTRPPGRDPVPMEARLERAREVMEQYGEPLADPDRWQRFNTPAIVARPDRKLMYHGWFMATDREAMMQYWRENLLDDGNAAFLSLDVPFLDVRAIRPWDETPEATIAGIEETIERIGPGPAYRRLILRDTPHFVMEERPELLDRIVADFLADRETVLPGPEKGGGGEAIPPAGTTPDG